ncbi:hypothetical protein WICMUC_000091 [Wickerhamomyces mucosus]|uniref:Uncharacterized protein n=1 Tax=Wickerhamomyces mucosus TaxID=1378264 RepID=A0A9P8PYZ6_9ASCO|nr:hypothetical protein WICMUC_000091 [Wickerhamomyces mucosus]
MNDSVPDKDLDSFDKVLETSISGAPPPAINAFSLTKQRITHKASCNERSVSSKIKLLAPRQTIETVGWVTFLTPVISTILEPDDSISSTKSAEPNLSSVNKSISEIGLQDKDLLKNSISSRSISLITIIPNFDKKCNDKSLTASLKIDF